MTQRRIILVSVVCFSLTVFTVQTLPQTPSSNRILKPPDAERLRNMTEEERKKEFEKWREQSKLHWERLRNMTEEEREKEFAKMRRQRELERERSRKKFRKKSAERKRQMEPVREQRKLEREQRRKEWEKKKEEAGGFIFEKFALGATEEQWKLIKAKLEKVRQLREQANSMVGVRLTSSSSGGAGARPNVPAFQWKMPWKDKAPSELTEAQKLAKELIALVERKNTNPQAFRRKMDALRKARSEQAQFKRQLSDARRELCEILTTRQEATLVLMNRL